MAKKNAAAETDNVIPLDPKKRKAAAEKAAKKPAKEKPAKKEKPTKKEGKPAKKEGKPAKQPKEKPAKKEKVPAPKKGSAGTGHKAQTQVSAKVWGLIEKEARSAKIRPADVVRAAIYAAFGIDEDKD